MTKSNDVRNPTRPLVCRCWLAVPLDEMQRTFDWLKAGACSEARRRLSISMSSERRTEPRSLTARGYLPLSLATTGARASRNGSNVTK